VKTLHVIGCGRVGRTLARLWVRNHVFDLRCVLNRSLESARRAVDFVAAGRAVEAFDQLDRADVVMIAASDEAVPECCRLLAQSNAIGPGTVVFHCSGALASEVLAPARERGASIAAIHPVKSFADAEAAVDTFPGTFCALEGDPAACQVLRDALTRCGAIPFAIDPGSKPIYHAATVLACNYLVALVEVALRCLEHSGVPRETGLTILRPLVTETVGNVFTLGPSAALTGPIARGETSIVAAQSEALGQWDEGLRHLYRLLGRVALELAAAQGNASPEALAAIARVLEGVDGG
jgi:predicted short-subunit dehydrogenase-like oxidoreductase (DUF2520 family)